MRTTKRRQSDNAARREAGPGALLRRIPSLLGRRDEAFLPPDVAETLNLVRNFEESRQGWFWATDEDGRLTYLSESVCDLLKVGHEELVGSLFASFFALAEEESDTGRALPFLLLKRSKFEKLGLRSALSNRERWWSVSGSPQFDAAGNFTGFLGSAIDITEQRRSSEDAARLAKYDSLTGLSNRLRMLEVLKAHLTASKQHSRPCAVMMIDLDRFKQVNDTIGHPAGDALLNRVAERLLRIVGDKERVARLGGDEFHIILPDCGDRKFLGDLANKIIAALSLPYAIAGSRCTIGASIGVAVAPADGNTLEDLIRNVDLALYASKVEGRGRFRFFSSEMLRAAEDKRALEEDLRDALARNEIELAYQAIVDARTDCATGVEALIRWRHPQAGDISPATFIPIAEESGLIGPLGEWVLRKACEDAAKWPGKLRVAVNVSPVQFSSQSLPEIVVSALAASGLSPDRLELEVTEGVLLSDSPATDAMFATLKKIGVRLVLDDFGTGYASLGYLRTSPFDKIKIDQSFVRAATLPGSRNHAIIAAIVALADALGMETTAEGVETLDQLQLVRNLGASHVQGFVYSKAVSCLEVSDRIKDGDWVLPPAGPVSQRSERQAMYRTAGAICGSRYQPVLIRNLSESGALIEGLGEPPVGDLIVIDFGDGELAFATVRRTSGRQWGVAFHEPLVRDGANGVRPKARFSPERLEQAGYPMLHHNVAQTCVVQVPITPEKLAANLGMSVGSTPRGGATTVDAGEGAAGPVEARTLREFAVEYLDTLRGDRERQQADDRVLRQYILPRFGHLRRDQIADADLENWIATRISDMGCSQETAQRLRLLVKALGWLAERKAGEASPSATDLKQDSLCASVGQLTRPEAEALVEAIRASHNRQLRFIVSLLILTGARQRELLQARWADVDLERRVWKITLLRSGKKREVPLADVAIKVIEGMPRWDGCAYMFANPATRQPYRSLAKSWDTARTRAGLSDLEIDDLRYCVGDRATFVDRMLDSTINPPNVGPCLPSRPPVEAGQARAELAPPDGSERVVRRSA